MANMIEDAMSMLSAELQRVVASSITYTRAGLGSVDVTARVGRQAFRLGQDGESRLEWSDKDFIVPVADLAIGGSAITPRRGDQITYRGRVYQVQAPGGEPPARHTDSFGTDWRIHTKLVG